MTRMIGALGFVAVIAIVGLVSEVVGVVQQIPVQRGIDRHTFTLIGTYTERVTGSWTFDDDTYVLSYRYEDRDVSTRLRGLPGNPKLGDRYCVEIDATRPEHGRVCGTRGGFGDAESGLIWGGSILTVVVTAIALLRWRLRRQRRLAIAD